MSCNVVFLLIVLCRFSCPRLDPSAKASDCMIIIQTVAVHAQSFSSVWDFAMEKMLNAIILYLHNYYDNSHTSAISTSSLSLLREASKDAECCCCCCCCSEPSATSSSIVLATVHWNVILTYLYMEAVAVSVKWLNIIASAVAKHVHSLCYLFHGSTFPCSKLNIL